MFKDFISTQDVSTQKSIVNEIVSLTGTLFSGATNTNVKTYFMTSGSALSGGFFTTIYDGATTSATSTALVDLTFGISISSSLTTLANVLMPTEKNRVYKEMAQRLLGSKDALFNFNNTNYNDLFFISLKRRLFKDEIKKGSVSILLDLSGSRSSLLLTDIGATSGYDTGPAGDEADLYSGSFSVGKVYYNAGVAVFHTGVFLPVGAAQSMHWSGSTANKMNLDQVAITGSIDNVCFGLKNHINDTTVYNQTNLHSLIYFCRALNNEFNYSSNPTFLDSEGRIIPTSGTDNQTRSYITRIGLYDINDNLLAVANLSSPVKKSPDSEVVVRVRLNF